MSTTQLTRSETNRILGGVCGGLADYLGLPANLIRLAFFLLAFASGMGVILYLLLLIIIPRESHLLMGEGWQKNLDDLGETFTSSVKQARQDPNRRTIAALVLIAFGVYFLLTQLGLLNVGFCFPAFLLVIGILLVARGRQV